MKMKTIASILLFLAGLTVVRAERVFTIYPVPHAQERLEGTAALAARATLVAEPAIDQYTIDRALQILSEHGIEATVGRKAVKGCATVYLGVAGSRGVVDKMARRWGLKRDVFGLAKYDRHIVSIRQERGAAQLLVLGENTDAVFCGLASVEQILDAHAGQVPCATIYDYADVKDRGVIEGYYGVPYTGEVTKDLFRFMARFKLNTYMYGAKSDPYHSHYWDKPYPESITAEQKAIGMLSQEMLQSIVSEAHRCKVNFIWAIHPGASFIDAAQGDVVDRIMQKFSLMYALGVRQFGVFVDDVGVPSDEPNLKRGADRLTQLQQRIDEQWNRKGAAPADTVKPLNYVPQLYAYSWVKREQAERFFRSLSSTPSKVSIYITGRAVWTVPNSEDPALVSSWLGREVAWWWNYPCNDNDMNKIFPADTYANFRDESHINNQARLEPNLRGVKTLISNPMQQGTVSKIALFGIADYAWNMASFDNMTSWQASLPALFGQLAPVAERLLPQLRYYDGELPLARLIEGYEADTTSAAARSELSKALGRVAADAKALEAMSASKNESERLMWDELAPYVHKVADMARLGTHLLAAATQPAAAPRDTTATRACCASAACDGCKRLEQLLATEAGLDTAARYRITILSGMGSDIRLAHRYAEPSARALRPLLKRLARRALSAHEACHASAPAACAPSAAAAQPTQAKAAKSAKKKGKAAQQKNKKKK